MRIPRGDPSGLDRKACRPGARMTRAPLSALLMAGLCPAVVAVETAPLVITGSRFAAPPDNQPFSVERLDGEIGRASCRERVWSSVGAVAVEGRHATRGGELGEVVRARRARARRPATESTT